MPTYKLSVKTEISTQRTALCPIAFGHHHRPPRRRRRQHHYYRCHFFVVNLQDEPVRLRMKINAAVKKPPKQVPSLDMILQKNKGMAGRRPFLRNRKEVKELQEHKM